MGKTKSLTGCTCSGFCFRHPYVNKLPTGVKGLLASPALAFSDGGLRS